MAACCARPIVRAQSASENLEELYYQPNLCGPVALFWVCRRLGVETTIDDVAHLAGFNGREVTLAGLASAAEQMGLQARGYKANVAWLRMRGGPAILESPEGHFVTFLGWTRRGDRIYDPPHEPEDIAIDDLEAHWSGHVLFVARRVDSAGKRDVRRGPPPLRPRAKAASSRPPARAM